jgi:general secretion pathway protein M
MNAATRALVGPALLWLLLIGGGVWLAVDAVQGVRAKAAGHLDAYEPRLARLQGIAADSAKLAAAAAAASAAVAHHVYPSSREVSQAGNDAQQRARDLFIKGGLEVSRIQVLPARGHPPFDRIPITLRAEGPLSALQATFAALPSLAPSLFVEGFTLQGINVTGDKPVGAVVEVQLFVLRLQP